MDAHLRKEIGGWKPEVEDRLRTLEDQMKQLLNQPPASPAVNALGKKGSSDVSTTDGNA